MKFTAAKHALQTLIDQQRKLNSSAANRGESEKRGLRKKVESRTSIHYREIPEGTATHGSKFGG